MVWVRLNRRVALRLAPLLLGALLGSWALVGCTDRPAAGGVYREAVIGQPLSLNPLLDPRDPIVRDVSRLLFAGLVRVVDGGELQGDLAEGWATSDEGRTYVFRLRPNVRWHDGQPVVAADVVSTVAILRAADYSGPLDLAAPWRGVHAEALDSKTVRFRLDEPFAAFIEICSVPILPSHLVGPADASRLRELGYSYAPVGAGPFQLVAQSSSGLHLRRHGDYVGPRAYLDEVEFLYFAEAGAALAALQKGMVDGFVDVPPEVRSTVLQDERLQSMQAPILAEQTVLFLNQAHPILRERPVRQAIASTIDRRRLFGPGAVMDGLPAFGPIVSSSWAYSRVVEREPDLAVARSLLEGAGWVGLPARNRNGQGLALRLVTTLDRRLVALAEAIQEQLSALGVDVSVQPTNELDLYREQLGPHRFDMALVNIGVGGTDPDPSALWDSAQVTGGFNFASYQSAEADEYLRVARRQGDPGRRREALEAFQRVWGEDVPGIVLGHPMLHYALSNRIRGVRLGVVGDRGSRFQHIAEWYVEIARGPALLR